MNFYFLIIVHKRVYITFKSAPLHIVHKNNVYIYDVFEKLL
jgi:hypothetical protein